MSDTFILDANGDPIGAYRANQDPSVPQRLHPVPAMNASGEPILDADEPVMHMLPLDDPRVVTELEAQGLVLDGTVIVAAE